MCRVRFVSVSEELDGGGASGLSRVGGADGIFVRRWVGRERNIIAFSGWQAGGPRIYLNLDSLLINIWCRCSLTEQQFREFF